MAAPANTTIKNLNGSWVMDSTLSDPADPILTLQGMSWVVRKAISYATVTLHVNEYADSTNPQVYHIEIDQVVTGGIKASKEARQLDWQEREHVDSIFGTLRGKSRFVRGSKADDGKVRPAVDFQSKVGDAEKDAKIQRFLRGEVLLNGAATEGFVVDDEGAEFGEGEGLWMQSFVVNQEKGWTAEQIWGFEIIEGQRHHTRRVAVVKGDQVELSRLVYKFEGPKPE